MISLKIPSLVGSNIFGTFGENKMENYFIEILKKEDDKFLLNLDLDYFNFSKDVYSKKEIEIFNCFYKKTYTLIQANKLEFKPNKLHINVGDFIMEINCYKDKIVCEKPQIKEMKCLLIETK
jgi:hypothetical protein